MGTGGVVWGGISTLSLPGHRTLSSNPVDSARLLNLQKEFTIYESLLFQIPIILRFNIVNIF